MATQRWLGVAKQVTQVNQVVITGAGTWAGKTITVTTGSGSVATVTIGTLVTLAQVTTTLYQAWEGVTFTDTTATSSPTIADGGFKIIPELYELAATIPTVAVDTVTLTARTSGKPILITVSDDNAGGNAANSVTTAATGKHFWDNATNWSGGSVPITADDLVFDTGNVDLLYTAFGATPANNLVTSIQPLSVTVTQGFTGKIGLAATNADDQSRTYYEYRQQYLRFAAVSGTTTITAGLGDGQGARRVKFDMLTCITTLIVHNTGIRNETDFPTLLLKGTNASNQATVYKGDVGFAVVAGETTTLATLRCGTDSGSNVKVYCGSGVTLTTVITVGTGNVTLQSNCTTLTMEGCFVDYVLGAPATASVWSGTLIDRSSTTIGTALSVGPTGVYDRSYDTRAKIITPKVSIYRGGKFLDPNATLTMTGGWQAMGCKDGDVVTDFGYNRNYSVS